MMRVIPGNGDVVATLTAALERAKTGKTVAVGLVEIGHDANDSIGWEIAAAPMGWARLVAGASWLHHTLLTES